MNYYNEFDPAAAQWIRNLISAGLIPTGDVDERSIEDVTPNELRGYTQCHFFAGVAGWSYALALAGRSSSESLWTGSCPCQPFSAAGKGAGFDDQRHLWPAWFHLIRQLKPERIFGEQVASAVGHGWLDLVSADLEAEGYAVGATVLGAHSVGAPHIRQRLYFVADSNRRERDGLAVMRGTERDREDDGRQKGGSQPESCGEVGELADSEGKRRGEAGRSGERSSKRYGISSEIGELGHAINTGSQGHRRSVHVDDSQGWQGAERHGAASGFWDGEWRIGADGKARIVEPGIEPLAHGVSARMVRLRAYGNAICPQTAAAFIRAYMTAEQALSAAA